MSDTALDKIINVGTAAARAAFTPSPGTSRQLFIWVDNDSFPSSDPATWVWDSGSSAWIQINTAGAGSVTTGVTLTSGVTIVGAGSSTIGVSSLTAQFVGSSSGTLAAASMSTARLLGRTTASSGAVEEISTDPSLTLSGGVLKGRIVQVVNTQTGAVIENAVNTQIPVDDSIPQNTEGDEYMTLAITPISATNKLLIEVLGFWSVNQTGFRWITAALFQDTTSDALAAQLTSNVTTANAGDQIRLTHYMTAGTTSATTFKVRVGLNSTGAVTFNGSAAGRLFGGVMASSITITEITV